MYDFRIKDNYLRGVNTVQFGICETSHVSLLEPKQNNLNNPEAYSEPCQTSKMEYFANMVNG